MIPKYLIHRLAKEGDQNGVRALLHDGIEVDCRDKYRHTPLQYAAMRGHVDLAHLLMERGADIHAVSRDGKTALHYAAMSGRNDIIRLLLRCGAEVNKPDTFMDYTPLHLAAGYSGFSSHANAIGTVSLLLAAGADIHARARFGITALTTPVIKKQLDLAEYLIWCGADIEARNSRGLTLFLLAVEHSVFLESVTFLLEKGVDLEARDNDGRTALHCAALRDDLRFGKLLLENGADILATDYAGKSVLDYALEAPPSPWIRMMEEIEDPEKRAKCAGRLAAAYQAQQEQGDFWVAQTATHG